MLTLYKVKDRSALDRIFHSPCLRSKSGDSQISQCSVSIAESHDGYGKAIEDYSGLTSGQIIDYATVQTALFDSAFSNGKTAGRKVRQKGVAGYDLLFAAPKDVSLLWAFAPNEHVRECVHRAHVQAVNSAMTYLASNLKTRLRGAEVGGLVYEGFYGLLSFQIHGYLSRQGDPHIYTHALLLNRQMSLRDGKWRAPDSIGLYYDARSIGAIYQASLRRNLTASLGLAWGEVENGIAPATYPHRDELVKQFSQSAELIRESVADMEDLPQRSRSVRAKVKNTVRRTLVYSTHGESDARVSWVFDQQQIDEIHTWLRACQPSSRSVQRATVDDVLDRLGDQTTGVGVRDLVSHSAQSLSCQGDPTLLLSELHSLIHDVLKDERVQCSDREQWEQAQLGYQRAGALTFDIMCPHNQ